MWGENTHNGQRRKKTQCHKLSSPTKRNVQTSPANIFVLTWYTAKKID